jgi:hypothetical protein
VRFTVAGRTHGHGIFGLTSANLVVSGLRHGLDSLFEMRWCVRLRGKEGGVA